MRKKFLSWWLRKQIGRMSEDIERLTKEREYAAHAIDAYQQRLAQLRGELWALEWPASVKRSAFLRTVDEKVI